MSRPWPVVDVDPDAAIEVNARRILAVRIAELFSYSPIASQPEMSEALHDMRIAAKRLRYTLEIFRPQLAEAGERQIHRVKAIQEALGSLHDHDVRISLIGDELSRLPVEQSRETRAAIAAALPDDLESIAASAPRPLPDDPRRGLIALLGREHAARRAAFNQFHALWERFGSEGMRADLVSLSTSPLPRNRAPRVGAE